MSLFTNDYQPDLNPYFTDPTQDPAYQRRLQLLKKIQKEDNTLFGIAGGAIDIGSIFTSLIPGGGGVGGAADKVGHNFLNMAKGTIDKPINNAENRIYAHFPTAGGAPTNGDKNSTTGNINTDAIGKILKLMQQKQDNGTFQTKDPNTGKTSTGKTSSSQLNDILSNPWNVGNDTANAAAGSTGSEIADNTNVFGSTIDFAGGGLMKLQKGENGDDIALVDTKDGSDTGVRVQKGEMLVVSKENLASLHTAIEKGDHKKVFNLMKEQVKQAPKVKDGKKGLAEGGPVDIPEGTSYTTTNGTEVEYKNGKWVYGKKQINAGEEVGDNKLLQEINTGYELSQKNQEPITLEPNKAETSSINVPYSTSVAKTAKPTTPPKTLPDNPEGEVSDELGEGSYDPFKRFKNVDNTTAPPSDFNLPPQGTPQDLNAQPQFDLPPYEKVGQPATSDTGTSRFGDYARFYAPEIAGTAYDITRGILGFNAARKPLPTFTKPEAWNQYLNRLHGLSESGLTGNELTAAQRNIDTGYAADVANIRDLSGGNSGLALANLGRAAGGKYSAQTNLAALNDEARARNLGEYGSALTTDLNLDRMIFNDAYQPALWSKEQGAKTANDAIKNLSERASYIGDTGPGSAQWQLKNLNLDNATLQNKYLKANQDYISKNPDWWKNYSSSGNNSSSNTVPDGYTHKSSDGTTYVFINGKWEPQQ